MNRYEVDTTESTVDVSADTFEVTDAGHLRFIISVPGDNRRQVVAQFRDWNFVTLEGVEEEKSHDTRYPQDSR